MNCPFCELNDRQLIDQNRTAICFYDKYPVTEYHTLIVPKRHVANYFDLSIEEFNDIHRIVELQKIRLETLDSSITGFNIGINIGEDAGQSVFHVHIHLIPRRAGDMNNPKGGVRGVIPNMQKY